MGPRCRLSQLAAGLLLVMVVCSERLQAAAGLPAGSASAAGGRRAGAGASVPMRRASSEQAADQAAAAIDGEEESAPGAASDTQPFPAVFMHPLAPPTEHERRQIAVNSHAEMQRWLAGYFKSSASRMTSSRLKAERDAAAAAAKAAADRAAAAAAAPPPVGPAAPAADAPPAEPEPPPWEVEIPLNCSVACLRDEAARMLAAPEPPHVLRWPRFAEDPRRWAAGPGPNGTCLPRQPGEALRRDFLLLAPVGNDLSSVSRWLNRPQSATFDLLLLHYGNASDAQLAAACPGCGVLRAKGPKWRLVWQATRLPSWRRLAAGKRAVMTADDDLQMDTCAINRAFEVFSAYGLLLGQPSLCKTEHRPTWYLHLLQDQSAVLRFVTMVEIMAPIFEMDLFQGLARPSLHDAYTGWGLDFVWPFLLHYPRDRIAVIDDVCMIHPHFAESKTGDGSVYSAAARFVRYDAREEEARRGGEYGYYPSEVQALGFPYRPIEVVGVVPQPPPPPPPPEPPAAERAPSWPEPAAEVVQQAQPEEQQQEQPAEVAQQQQQQQKQPEQAEAQQQQQQQPLHPPEPAPQHAAQPRPQPAAALDLMQPPRPAPQLALHSGLQPGQLPNQRLVQLATVATTTEAQPSQAAQQTAVGSADPTPLRTLAAPAAVPLPAQAAVSWTVQHWLLFVQLSLLLSAVAALLLYGSRQRRPHTPRVVRVLPAHKKPFALA